MFKLVCVAGMAGAGKSAVSDYFVKKRYQFLRLGQITLDEVKRKGLKVTEKNEKKVREGMRKAHGMAAYAILNFPKIQKLLKKGNVIADGLYSWSEYKFFKQKLGHRMTLIAVYAPPNMRYKRLTKRITKKSDTKVRNRPLIQSEAKSRDYADIENIEKGGPIAMADYTILNTKDLKFLMKQVKTVYAEIKKS